MISAASPRVVGGTTWSAPERFDLSSIGREHREKTRSLRLATTSISYFLFALGLAAAVSVFAWGLLVFPLGSPPQLLRFGVVAFLLVPLTVGIRGTRWDAKNWSPIDVTVEPSGTLRFQFLEGSRLSLALNDRTTRMFIDDFRSTFAGSRLGAPCMIRGGAGRDRLPNDGVPLSGPACDAILQSCKASGLEVTRRLRPSAGFWGQNLGTVTRWTMSGPKHLYHWR